MQKKLIALAIAGLSGAAFAQSNVTVYGVADMYYGNASASGKTNTTAINSGGLAGSRLGFKGTEALGNGTSALFVLEYALAMDANTGVGGPDSSANQARQQLVGLTGGWGTAVAGYAQTAGYDFACQASPLAGSALDSYSKIGSSFLLACGKAGRAGNAVAYISPSFGGFTVAVNHARVSESAGAGAGTGTSDSSANLVSGIYANGPLKVNLTFAETAVAQTTGATSASHISEYGLNGSYNFGVAKAYASYQSKDTKDVAGKDTKWGLGVSIPVAGTGSVVVQYSKSNLKDDDVAATPTTLDNGGKAWTLAYAHGLSKRTTAYVGYVKVNNEANGTNAALLTPTAGGSSSVFAAGINHSF